MIVAAFAPARRLRAAGSREPLACAVAAAAVASLLLWLGPPGTDVAAHVYQRGVLLEHGFALWNNFWYAGRYSFVTYSLAYYPLAAVVGIRLLALVSIAVAGLAFAAVVGREWGRLARWPARLFGVVWACGVLSGNFPFLLGAAFALLALWSIQLGRRGRFAIAVAATLAASPLAFLLLAVVLTGLALCTRRRLLPPAATVLAAGGAELLLWRLFPDPGRYPFPLLTLLPACAFCAIGVASTWRVEAARPLRFVFGVYLVVIVGAYALPSALGENVARLRFAAIPLALLALSLRRFRPLPLAVVVLGLACSWNLTPLAANAARSARDPSGSRAYWAPAIWFLRRKLSPQYRVEAVDTAAHWDAAYLPAAGIPLARGWFRQDDFPENSLLYGPLGRREYLAWLRRLAVRYVVLSDAPTDYSARAEAALLRSGRSGLTPVFRARRLVVYRVPRPAPLVRGPGSPRMLDLTAAGLRVRLDRAGAYRLAVRYSPYWRASGTCVRATADGMIRLTVPRPETVDLDFTLTPGRALASLLGSRRACYGNGPG